ncbi:hypothetical protein CEXT_707451, partial [Caerostris extrusa]
MKGSIERRTFIDCHGSLRKRWEDDNVTDYMFNDQSDPSEPDMSFYIDNPPLTEMECANYNNSLLQ